MNKPVLPLSSLSLKLPKADRSLETYRLAASRSFPAKLEGSLNRVAFSAAHVVADPLADADPWLSAAVEKISLLRVGMVVFRSINLVNTPPSVSIPSDSGVTSSSRTSFTSPPSTPP